MEFSNELFKCRLCLCGSENFVHIFNVNVETSYILADLITDLLKFEVSRVDGYPQFVCSACCNKLTEFQIFKELCITCKETYDHGNLEPETILGDTNILETNHHPIKLEEELDAQYITVNRQMPVSEEITSEIVVKKECMDDERDAHSEVLAITRQTSHVSESGSRTSTLMPTCSNSNSYGNKSPFNFFPQREPSYERVSVKLENSESSNPFEGRLEEGLVGDDNQEDSSEEAFDVTFGAREENRSSAEMPVPSVRMAGTRKMNIGEQRPNKKRKAAEERDKDESRKVCDGTFGTREESPPSAETAAPGLASTGKRKKNIGEQHRNKKKKAEEETNKDNGEKGLKPLDHGLIEILLSTKGKAEYLIDGYIYQKNASGQKDILYLQCSRARHHGCSGRATIVKREDEVILKLKSGTHNHEPNTHIQTAVRAKHRTK